MAGYYGVAASGGCTPCPAGTYKNNDGDGDINTCIEIPSGSIGVAELTVEIGSPEGSIHPVSLSGTRDFSAILIPDFPGYMWISTDYTETWSPLTSLGIKYFWSAAISEDHTQIAVTEAGAHWQGGFIYVSHDSGSTWDVRGGFKYWRQIVCDETFSKLIAVSVGPVMLSDNSGDSWYPSATIGTGHWVGVCASSDLTKIVLTTWDEELIYYSHESGATWLSVGCPGTALDVSGDSALTNLIVAKPSGSSYTSTNSGSSWSVSSNTFAAHGVLAGEVGRVFAISGSGNLVYSTDRGETYSQVFSSPVSVSTGASDVTQCSAGRYVNNNKCEINPETQCDVGSYLSYSSNAHVDSFGKC
jgi:hypothetical protein